MVVNCARGRIVTVLARFIVFSGRCAQAIAWVRKLLLYPPELRGRPTFPHTSVAHGPAPRPILALCAHLGTRAGRISSPSPRQLPRQLLGLFVRAVFGAKLILAICLHLGRLGGNAPALGVFTARRGCPPPVSPACTAA